MSETKSFSDALATIAGIAGFVLGLGAAADDPETPAVIGGLVGGVMGAIAGKLVGLAVSAAVTILLIVLAIGLTGLRIASVLGVLAG